jgi:hypothetical protein
VREERHQLLDDIRRLASGLVDSADAAVARLPRLELAQPEDEMVGDETEDGTTPPTVATKQSAPATAAVGAPAVGFDEDGDKESPPVSPSG